MSQTADKGQFATGKFTSLFMPVNANEYIPKYPQLTPDEILMYSQHFNSLDADDSGKLGITEIMALFKSIQVPATRDEVKKYIEEVDIDGDGLIDFGEFLTIFIKEKESGASSKLSEGLKKQQNLIKAAGARGEHAYPQEEVTGFVNYLNQELGEDPALQHILPIDPEGDALFTAVQDRILMCKLLTLVHTDIREGVPHLVLGLTWQLIRESLLKDIQLTVHPELFRLLKPGETIEDLLKLKPEEILLR
ncbi:plastin-3 [Histomonas meleagridis]|nr:plastin-3 [Histomonas meleagridis]